MQITVSEIQHMIFEIRGQKVMLDRDLAEMYEVETRALNQSIKRNISRFPADFMFQLTKDEFGSLMSQIVISKKVGRGGTRKMPYVFTEQGVAMLSSVLNSEKAIEVNISIIRTFVIMRQYAFSFKELADRIKKLENKYNKNFNQVFKALDLLLSDNEMKQDFKERKRIGFKP